MNEQTLRKLRRITKERNKKHLDALTNDLRNRIPELTKEEARRICQNAVNESTKQLL